MNSAENIHPSSPPTTDEVIQTSADTDEFEDFVLANEIPTTESDEEFQKIWREIIMANQGNEKLIESKSHVKLPHALGSHPSYLSASKSSKAPKSPSSLSLGLLEFSDNKLDYLKRQVLHLSNQARESNEKAFKLAKIIDHFHQNSSDVIRDLRASELKISEQDGKIKVLRQKLKFQSDKIEQISKLEIRVANLSKLNEGYVKENNSKDENIQKLSAETRRLRNEIEKKKKIIEAAKSETEVFRKSSAKTQKQQQSFEVELDSRDVQIDILRKKFQKLEQENNELKIELNHANDKVRSIGGDGDNGSTSSRNSSSSSQETIKSLKSKLANYEIMVLSKMVRLKGDFEMILVDDGKSLKNSEISFKVKCVADEEEY